jgi:hypothetical protein
MTAIGLDLDEGHRGAAGVERRTVARESLVGKSQSEVKETTQKRVRESLKALASDPP